MMSNELVGLVLIGGQSKRMGQDKSLLVIENCKLYQRAAKVITPFCAQLYLSVNQNQNLFQQYEYPIIVDDFEAQGPISGLVTSHYKLRSPILLIGCDLPFILDKHVQSLLQYRNEKMACTVFYDDESCQFEPLLSIWEPQGLELLSQFFNAGGRSFQNFLHQNQVTKIPVKDKTAFRNINSMEDYETIFR